LGILLYGITQGAIFLALNALPAVTVNLLWSFSVIIVAGMAAVWLSETPTALQWTGVFVATAGALTYFLPARFALDQRFGLLAALVGVAANAGAAVLGRDVNRSGSTPPVVVTAISMMVGAAMLLGAGLALEAPPTLDLRGWSIILWLAVVNTALAFTLWNGTLRLLTAVESSVINGTMLIWIPILAAVFLGEHLTLKEAVGLVLVAGGTLLVQLKRIRPLTSSPVSRPPSAPRQPARRAPGGERLHRDRQRRQLADACPTTVMNSSTIWRKCFSGSAPTCWWAMTPRLTKSIVGIPCTPYFIAQVGFSSVLTLATSSRPAYSAASLSSTGATIRHGEHHGAQKSTMTGTLAWSTVFSKASSLT
ncbi:MAG: hypothetical protein HW404_1856, partial [Anaerolineales bacterium]|nr:hypothetical protein [Anaerolineales bacterium]